jgi:hypothetical protein
MYTMYLRFLSHRYGRADIVERQVAEEGKTAKKKFETAATKRDGAVLRQYSTKFRSFFNHYSLLWCSNEYGWVLLAEEVPHCWNGQAAKSSWRDESRAKVCLGTSVANAKTCGDAPAEANEIMNRVKVAFNLAQQKVSACLSLSLLTTSSMRMALFTSISSFS